MQAVLRLRELILSGYFVPGERIAELTVVAKLGMSRTPVRLALTTLEHEGLLETLPGGGFMVREFSLADIADAIELRGVLEGTAARLASERHTGAESLRPITDAVTQLDALLTKMDPSPAVFERYIELNDVFHAALIELARSPILKRSIEQAMALPFASPGSFLLTQAVSSESWMILQLGQDHHRSLLEAIEGREGARAEALGREHARLARRNLDAALKHRNQFRLIKGAALVRADANPTEAAVKR